MCGISGIVSWRDECLVSDVRNMASVAIHRGPDGLDYCAAMREAQGFTRDDVPTWCALAHNRLAIIDLSSASDQPMFSRDGRFCLVFNGEIYNYRELRSQLEQSGVAFQTQGDAEVLLNSLIIWGESALPRLRGMFAFAFVDSRSKSVLLARDPLGIKPLYYTAIGHRLLFASEIKQFSAVTGWKSSPNLRSLADFVFWGSSDSKDETCFNGVFSVPGGHVLRIDGQRQKQHKIDQWNTTEAASFDGNYRDAVHMFRETFSESLSMHLRSDVPIGSCLSGGLDSSSVVSGAKVWHGEFIGAHLTVTAGSEDSRLDETRFAQIVADNVGAKSVIVIPSVNELWELLPTISWHQDEPIASTSPFAQWKVFEAAKEAQVKVMLDGQGADELLAGYDSFVNVRLLELLHNRRLRSFFEEFSYFRAHARTSFRSFLSSSLSTRSNRKQMTTLGRLVGISDLDPKASLGPRLRAHLGSQNYFQPNWRKNLSVRDLSHDMLTRTSLPKLLRYEDRSSMAHGIEARVPFCDIEVVSFLSSLPSEFLIGPHGTKRILRDAMEGVVPQEILTRTDKIGFETSQSRWMKQSINHVGPLLSRLEERVPGFLPGWALDRVELTKRLHSSNTSLLWRMTSVAAWAERHEVQDV